MGGRLAMPTKRPTRSDKLRVAADLRFRVKVMRTQAQSQLRSAEVSPRNAEIHRKFAAQLETKAARFERVADDLAGVGDV
jgi:hypothetical protein